jgi:hypothetical protein
MWNTEGFHAVDVLPKGAAFNTNCYCKDSLSEIHRACPVRSNRSLVVHADNATPYASKGTKEFMKENGLRGAPYTRFSPILAPSYFSLFGCIKLELQGTKFRHKDDRLLAIREILNGMSGKGLKTMFIESAEPLQTHINAGGEYVE